MSYFLFFSDINFHIRYMDSGRFLDYSIMLAFTYLRMSSMSSQRVLFISRPLIKNRKESPPVVLLSVLPVSVIS